MSSDPGHRKSLSRRIGVPDRRLKMMCLMTYADIKEKPVNPKRLPHGNPPTFGTYIAAATT